jgi:glycosyltransferase involved in cell wall biosynthesis
VETDLLWWPHYNVPLFFRGRLVVTVYDAYHLRMRWSLGDLVKRCYAELLFGAVRRRAEKVFTISHFSKGELEVLARVPAERIVPIHLGVAPEWFDTKTEEGFRERPYLLFVGNVKPHKNLRRLIAAFAGLVDDVPHDLVIVGKRDGFITGDEVVARMAADLGDRVVFTGWVDDNDLRRYVANAALMVFPSMYEGFGLPPLEAMACVCPVVASDIPVLHEVCGDQVAYFDPTSVDAIRDSIVAELSAPRELVGAVEWARRYDWEDCIDATVAEFSSLLGKQAISVRVKEMEWTPPTR